MLSSLQTNPYISKEWKIGCLGDREHLKEVIIFIHKSIYLKTPIEVGMLVALTLFANL